MSRIFIAVFLFSFFNMVAQSSKETFDKANSLYNQKKYDEAAGEYEKILSSGNHSSVVLYNLGNSYFKAGKIGLAMTNFERARKISPRDEDINHNITYLNSISLNKIETLPQLFIYKWRDTFVSLFTVDGWTIVAYIFFLLFLFSIATFYITSYSMAKKISFYSAIPILFLLLFSIVTLIYKTTVVDTEKFAIVVEGAVVIKNSPDSQSAEIIKVYEGLKVKIDDNLDNWIKIKLADGRSGWVEKQKVAII